MDKNSHCDDPDTCQMYGAEHWVGAPKGVFTVVIYRYNKQGVLTVQL